MDIYIEFLVVFSLISMFILWKIWYMWTERRLRKKYKPENDRGRKGKEIEPGKFRAEEPNINSNGFEQPERREFLQETKSNDVGKDSDSNRELRFIRRK